jgi:hypothetical protein
MAERSQGGLHGEYNVASRPKLIIGCPTKLPRFFDSIGGMAHHLRVAFERLL